MRTGALFAGYGGLDMAVNALFGSTTAWVSDVCRTYDDGTVGHHTPCQSPCSILAHHWPDAPNHGDISRIDWANVEPVDILTGGFPCQDVSAAGLRKGMRPGTRSGLWSQMAYGISQLRPRFVVIENVRGLVSAAAHSDVEPCPWCLGGSADGEPDLRALGAVLGDLADIGYDAQWTGLRAADVGAPHGRFRIFIVASDTRSETVGFGTGLRGNTGGVGRGRFGHDVGKVVADSNCKRLQGVNGWTQGTGQASEPTGRGDGRVAVADPTGNGWDEGRAESAGIVGGSDAAISGSGSIADTAGESGRVGYGDDVRAGRGTDERRTTAGGSVTADPGSERHGRGQDGGMVGRMDGPIKGETQQRERAREKSGDRSAAVAWGDYGPAIRRWERLLGREAPPPTEAGAKGGQRLSPRFVEWMMGLPAGHVTDVPGLSRNAMLKALGNGVVPQQAYAAITTMMEGTR